MSLSRDGVYRLIGIAKGDIPASAKERQEAQAQYQGLIQEWTIQLQQTEPGELSLDRESVQATIEAAYREYRRGSNRTATRRRLQDPK